MRESEGEREKVSKRARERESIFLENEHRTLVASLSSSCINCEVVDTRSLVFLAQAYFSPFSPRLFNEQKSLKETI